MKALYMYDLFFLHLKLPLRRIQPIEQRNKESLH